MTALNSGKNQVILALVSALGGGAGMRFLGSTEGEARLRTAETAVAVLQSEISTMKGSLERIEHQLGMPRYVEAKP